MPKTTIIVITNINMCSPQLIKMFFVIIIVITADVGNTSPPQAPRPPRNVAASNVITKDAITRLKEYCEQKKFKAPSYACTEHATQQFSCRVNIEGRVFEGTVQGNKKKAKETAAQKAVVGLKIT